jgi:hypothetical protein
MARAVRIALVIGGIALFASLVRSVGVAALIRALGNGRALAGAVVLELVVDACHTLGWRAALGRMPSIGFWRLYWVRQAGTAVNQLTPTATLGGEVAKAMLVRAWIATPDAVASLVIAKVSFAIAQTLLVLLGLAALLGGVPRVPGTTTIALGALTTLVALLAAAVLQRRGILTAAGHALRRFGWSAPLATRAAALDARLAATERATFVRSVAWHGAGQVVGVAQLLWILWCLGTPVTAGTALAIEAVAVALDSALFFVPGRIGVQEGGRVLVFTLFGFGAATGLAVALLVRAGQLATVALGVAAIGYFSLASPAAESISGT